MPLVSFSLAGKAKTHGKELQYKYAQSVMMEESSRSMEHRGSMLLDSYTSARGPLGPKASTKSQIYFGIRRATEWTGPPYKIEDDN